MVGEMETSCYIIAFKGIPRFHYPMATPHRPSLGVRRSLHKLGQDIRDARRRRGLPAAVVAQRAFTSRPSIRRIEAGDASVSIGIYAAVLQALGLLDGLSQLADPSRDVTGLAIASENLPERVHLRRPRQKRDG
jgi:transcriptional regulator with XRE-family HTH domain